MRACFLGQNICALGFGVATLQTPPLPADEQTGKHGEPPVTANSGDQDVTPPSSLTVPIVHNPCHNSATHA
jgi:hypothetical protein